jgi:transposase-like protein
MTKRKRTHFSLQTKRAAMIELDRNGGNLYRTSQELGIAEQTLSDWAKAHREGRLLPPDLPADAALDDQLEHIVNRMVAIMPEKVEEASLQELTRSLTTILATMNQARAEKEQSGDVYDKFVRIMARFSNNGAAADNIPAPVREGED